MAHARRKPCGTAVCALALLYLFPVSAGGQTPLQVLGKGAAFIGQAIFSYSLGRGLDRVTGNDLRTELGRLETQLVAEIRSSEDRTNRQVLDVIRNQQALLNLLLSGQLESPDAAGLLSLVLQDLETLAAVQGAQAEDLISIRSDLLALRTRVAALEASRGQPPTAAEQTPDNGTPDPAAATVRSGSAEVLHAPGTGGPLGFAFATGRSVPPDAGDVVFYQSGGSSGNVGVSRRSNGILALGPVGWETVTGCPRYGRYGDFARLGEGHVYCLSLGNGGHFAKVIVDEIVPDVPGLYGVRIRYALQTSGGATFRIRRE